MKVIRIVKAAAKLFSGAEVAVRRSDGPTRHFPNSDRARNAVRVM